MNAKVSRRWAGVVFDGIFCAYIHDIAGFKDHLAPGMGTFNFSLLLPYLGEESLRIIEAHDPVDLAQLREGVRLLQEKGVL